MQKTKEKKNKDPFLLRRGGIITVFLVIFLLWIGSYYAIYLIYGQYPDEPEEVGDQFGAINALFSGFAFAGIIYTILLQRKELELQRNELEETREEFKIQNQTLKQQRFENTFFQLLSSFDSLVSRGMRASSGMIASSEFFRSTKGATEKSKRHSVLENIIREDPGVLEPLIDYSFNLIRVIHHSNLIAEEHKGEYMRIFSCFLTPQERLFLFIVLKFSLRQEINLEGYWQMLEGKNFFPEKDQFWIPEQSERQVYLTGLNMLK